MKRPSLPGLVLLSVIAGGCSASGGALPLGSDGAGGAPGAGSAVAPGSGGAFLDTGDAAVSKALSAHVENAAGIRISFVTVGCSGACADVVAVAEGGNPGYSYEWEDGSTNPSRRVCPTASTHYSVNVTDSPVRGELPRAAQTVTAPLDAAVIECPDGGGGPVPRADAGVSTQIVVPSTADAWLAGQPDGSTLSCQCASTPPGADSAPGNSPVLVPVVPGSTLTFSVNGTTNIGACGGVSPDGGCIVAIPITSGPANGLASLVVTYNALVGVFLDDAVPGGSPPPGLDAGTNTSFTTLSPELRQVFFIGDGLTGTGTGVAQQFVVPAGATRLFLGSSDSAGGNYNNLGEFAVVVTRH
jgi:hypothetical protein